MFDIMFMRQKHNVYPLGSQFNLPRDASSLERCVYSVTRTLSSAVDPVSEKRLNSVKNTNYSANI